MYHGTIDRSARNIFEKGALLSECTKPNLDFGRGFYTTPSLVFAKVTAMGKAGKNNDYKLPFAKPAVVTLEINESQVSKLNNMEFTYSDTEWLMFIIANRLEDITQNEYLIRNGNHNRDSKYDIVSGKTADGEITSLVLDIQASGIINDYVLREVQPSARWDGGDQISFHTQKGIGCIKVLGYDILPMEGSELNAV